MDYLSRKLKDYKILYCEDDEEVADAFISLLKKLSNNFVYAKDGEEGLKLFYKEKPDIIVTDIKMPKKNGLKMVEEIRKNDMTIPVVVLTAYGDEKFLMNAIELNVTKFLTKPLDKDKLLNSLRNIVAFLEEEKFTNRVRKKIVETTKEVIKECLNISVEPIMIMKNNKFIEANKKFEDLFNKKELKLLKKDIKHFDEFLEKQEGFLTSLDEVDEKNYYKNRVSIIKPNGKRQIFQIIPKKFYVKKERDESIIYILQNITYIEYQKLKIKHYSERLEDFIITNRYKKRHNLLPDNSSSEDKNRVESLNKSNINEDKNKNARKLNEEETKLLRKNHFDKISAEEFLNSLDDYVIEDIQELEECEDELDLAIELFSGNSTRDNLDKIILNMEKYARAIKNLQEFDELAEAIYSTINILIDIDINEDNIPKIQKFIENILLDLKSWRKTIFEDANTQDIHYLDSSLFSSCLQFELELKGEEPEEDEGEFEFF